MDDVGRPARRTAPIVWLLDRRQISPALLAAAEDRLPDAKLIRQSHVKGLSRRAELALGHALLQFALARELGCDPGEISVGARTAGRPWINAPRGSRPPFSLSHSGPWIACAVHATVEIGLDVEIVDSTRDFGAISEWVFGAEEHDWVLRQPDRAAAFYRLWTGKEALVKLLHQIGQPSPLSELRFVLQGESVAPPPPASDWHHEQIVSQLALSLMSAAPVGQPRVQPIDTVFLSWLGDSTVGVNTN